jgi:ABC-type nitrate/sulfonate/bicarbonate transport system permease component
MKRLTGFIFIVGLLAALEMLCRLGWFDATYFPPPSAIFASLFSLARGGVLFSHLGATLSRAIIGYGCATLIAVPVGLLIGEFRWVRYLLEPLVDMLRPMPSAAVIPVAILLFGIGNEMKVAVIIFGSVWPTIISTVDGIRGVDPLIVDTGRLLQLTPVQSLVRIVLPAAMPTIMTGMRISLAIALILTVTSEMIAGSDGLGYFILDAERSFAFREMFAGIIVVGLVGYLASRGFAFIDGRLLFWHYASRARSDSVR